MIIPTSFCAKRATVTGYFWRSALVSVVAALLLFGLVGVPQNLAQMPSPSFEIASIKPNRSGDLRMMISSQPGRYTVTGVTTKLLSALLSQQLGRRVMDQAGLKRNYDFTLQWTPDQRPAAMPVGPVGGSSGADAVTRAAAESAEI